MQELDILQSTDFRINELSILTKGGKIDIREMFEEINIYDGLFSPVRSGNILIRDALNLSELFSLDGTEFLVIDIEKGTNFLPFKASFRIYKQSNRQNTNQSSELYVLHFVSDEFIYSSQQKINQTFKGTYSDAVASILLDYLNIPSSELFRGGSKFDKSIGVREFVVPNLNPIEAIEWCSKRAIDVNGSPSFVFFQNRYGYNFCSLSSLSIESPIFTINFDVKNIGNNVGTEISGARDYRIIKQFDYLKTTQSGVYAGKFVGFDPLTRTVSTAEKSFFDQYGKMQHSNEKAAFVAEKNRDGKYNIQMSDSRKVVASFSESLKYSSYVKSRDPSMISKINDTHNYLFQRKAVIDSFTNKRIRLLMPGNFTLSSGFNVELNLPSRSFRNDQRDDLDTTLRGVYTIVSTRHIIKYNMHETIIDVSTDSTQQNMVPRTDVVLQDDIVSYA